MNIVLVEPEIPPNTGNVARLCAATQTTLHLIEPFGFKLDDAQLKRAGMDYWQHVEWHRWPDWNAFELAHRADAARFWFIESGGPVIYSHAKFHGGRLFDFRSRDGGFAEAVAGTKSRTLAADSDV
jgi:tRNA (cytidine/uridine-2'-O-)-methyltransferase